MRRGKLAKIKARKAYKRAIRLPKRVIAKKYANTVGQIVAKNGRRRPSHGRRGRKGRRNRRGRY